MSYSVNFNSPDGGDEVFFLCNTATWTTFMEYVQALPAGYHALEEFCRAGEFKDTSRISNELLTAQEINPPSDDSPAWSVLESLIEHVGVGDEDETIYLSQD